MRTRVGLNIDKDNPILRSGLKQHQDFRKKDGGCCTAQRILQYVLLECVVRATFMTEYSTLGGGLIHSRR
jgi:hypothetical protein